MAESEEISVVETLRQPTLRALTSLVLSRVQLATMGSTTFGGSRNVFETLGYRPLILPQDYRARYRRNGVAARVVEAKATSTWRGGGELIETEDETKETEFEKIWEELNERLKFWTIFERADILAGLGRYAVILVGAPGEFDTPLPRLRPDSVLYLSVHGEDEAPIQAYVTDIHDKRFGQPEYYSLLRSLEYSGVTSPNPSAKRVHWTRCIHVADGLLDDNIFGTPRLERVWNLLDDLEKVTGGGAEAYWMRADRGLQFDLDKEMELSEPERLRMKSEIEEYQHRLKRILTTRGVKVNEISGTVSDFKSQCSAIIDQISAAVGIPQRILMGSEAGHLASTQDQENWAQRIRDRRRQFAEPLVVRPFVDRLIEQGALPEPKQYHVGWLELESLGDADRAKIAVMMANVNKLMAQEVFTPDDIRTRVMGYPPSAGNPKVLPGQANTATGDHAPKDRSVRQALPMAAVR